MRAIHFISSCIILLSLSPLVIGCPNECSRNGVCTASPSSSISPTLLWEQQDLAIAGDSADDVAGTSVAISGDGRTLAVGAPGSNMFDRPGYVKVYYKQFDFTAGWKWQLAETFTGKEVGEEFGTSVSMSEDGKTIAIGAPNNGPGYTRVYTRENDKKWTQLGEDIESEAVGDLSGESVSLVSSDGKTVAIGARLNDGNGYHSGHVRVYTVVEGDHGDSSSVVSWKQVGQDIDGEAERDYSGGSVSLSADGRTVAIGATDNDGGGEYSGHVRVYSLVGDEWEQIGQNIDGENGGDEFGTSVSLSGDGRTVAVGAHWNDDNGRDSDKVKVYRLDSSDGDSDDKWIQIGQDLNGAAADDWAGRSVSLSRDGKTLAIGAPSPYGLGYVRVHRLVGSDDSWGWTQVGKDIDGVKAGDGAGWSVALSSDGTVVAVGSPGNDDNGDWSGQVRVFGVDIEDVTTPSVDIEDVTTPSCVDTLNYLDMYRVVACMARYYLWGTCAEYSHLKRLLHEKDKSKTRGVDIEDVTTPA